jgi:hypothetical protein
VLTAKGAHRCLLCPSRKGMGTLCRQLFVFIGAQALSQFMTSLGFGLRWGGGNSPHPRGSWWVRRWKAKPIATNRGVELVVFEGQHELRRILLRSIGSHLQSRDRAPHRASAFRAAGPKRLKKRPKFTSPSRARFTRCSVHRADRQEKLEWTERLIDIGMLHRQPHRG